MRLTQSITSNENKMSDAVDSAAGGRLSMASRKQDAKAYGSRPSASWAADVE